MKINARFSNSYRAVTVYFYRTWRKLIFRQGKFTNSHHAVTAYFYRTSPKRTYFETRFVVMVTANAPGFRVVLRVATDVGVQWLLYIPREIRVFCDRFARWHPMVTVNSPGNSCVFGLRYTFGCNGYCTFPGEFSHFGEHCRKKSAGASQIVSISRGMCSNHCKPTCRAIPKHTNSPGNLQ